MEGEKSIIKIIQAQTKYSVNQLPGRVTWSSIQATNLLTRFLVKPNVDLRHKNTNQKVIKKKLNHSYYGK